MFTGHQITEVNSFRSQWKSELNSYRVEAAWKLGQWDLLEDYLSSGEAKKKKAMEKCHSEPGAATDFVQLFCLRPSVQYLGCSTRSAPAVS